MKRSNSINSELRIKLLDKLLGAAEGNCTLEDIFDWLTVIDVERRDTGFQDAADWLIRCYGSDEVLAGISITRGFVETDEYDVLVRFLRSDEAHFSSRKY